MQYFKLIPFPAKSLPNIKITGEVDRFDNQLSILYEINGDNERIILPEQSNAPTRKDDLWKETCFEIFLAFPNRPQYWEFNMSPSGDWNVYKMDTYRRVGFREEPLIERIQVMVQNDTGGFGLRANVDLTQLIQNGQDLETGIATVIQELSGSETYWALAHPGEQADFHLREGFIIRL